MQKNSIKTAAILALIVLFSMIMPVQSTYADTEGDDEILLTFGGDVTFGDYKGLQEEFFEIYNNDYSKIFENVYDIFSNDDLTFVNLETTLTEATVHKDETFVFKAPYEYVNILTEGSVEAVSIANNHAKDYLEQGRRDTVRTLYENDILVSGENYVISVDIKGIKVAILSYVTFKTGFNYMSAIERDIPYMNKTHDVVIVSMHWGNELVENIKSEYIKTAHKIVDLGADLVVGHHPHVINGIEYYKGKYILYSLGNCSFAGSSKPTEDELILFQQKFKKTENGVIPSDAKIIPCQVNSFEKMDAPFNHNDFRPTPYEDEDIDRVLNIVLERSSHMEYGLAEISDDWIKAPYTWEQYKLDKKAEEDKAG